MSDRKHFLLVALCALFVVVNAHDHPGENIPPGESVSPDPIDSILWVHIAIMMCCFGVIFPTGMVLGMVKSRWHVPLQVAGTCLAIVGWFLGHAHKGRQFKSGNIHSRFQSTLMTLLSFQIAFGVYLKLHLERGFHGKIRPYVVKLHSVAGKIMPLVAWIQMVFGGITALGFCGSKGDHTGQCLAHEIMGSAFIAYGIVMNILLIGGQAWLRRSGRSQEFFDSSVITLWGVINSLTEHRWGQPWQHNDIQHTSMGVAWVGLGLLGLFLSRNGRRNLVPGLVIFITGWAMAGHPQHLPVSTAVHTSFGYTLMGAGLTRMIEIAFLLKDKPALPHGEISSFQYLPSYLLYASGFIFMSATEEQMALIAAIGMDHVSYLLILYSLSALFYLFTIYLINLFVTNNRRKKPAQNGLNISTSNERARSRSRDPEREIGDAAEFELEGLMTDSEPETDSPVSKEART